MKSTLWVMMLGCAFFPFSMNGAARTEFEYKLKGCVRESTDNVVCRVSMIHRSGKSVRYAPKSNTAATLSVVGSHGVRSYRIDIQAPSGESGLTSAILDGQTPYDVLWSFQGVPSHLNKATVLLDGAKLGVVIIERDIDKPGQNRRPR